MRRLAAILLVVLIPALAQAQQIIQSGKPIPGRAGKWITNLTQGDAGPANGGPPGTGLTELNITSTLNNDQPFCINDAPITNTGGYHQLCMGAGGTFSYNAYGGASPLPLQFNINGANYNFPGPGNGNVVGPTPTTINEVASFNNTTGSLLRMGPSRVTDTTNATFSANAAAFGGYSNPTITAQQIAQWAFVTSAPSLIYDAVRGVTEATNPVSSSFNLATGVSGYVVSDLVLGSGPPGGYPASVSLFGVGVARGNGAGVWGINTQLSDTTGTTVNTGTGKVLYNEFDFNVTATATHVGGLQLAGASLAQPALANGFICQPLDSQSGAIAKWTNCLVTADGAANNAIGLGARGPRAASVPGQSIRQVWYDAGSNEHFIQMGPDGLTNYVIADAVISGGTPGLNLIIPNGNIITSQGIMVGGYDATPGSGDLIMKKQPSPTGAPGAGWLMLQVVAGTTAGTCKLLAYAGTGGAPINVVDNVGSGC